MDRTRAFLELHPIDVKIYLSKLLTNEGNCDGEDLWSPTYLIYGWQDAVFSPEQVDQMSQAVEHIKILLPSDFIRSYACDAWVNQLEGQRDILWGVLLDENDEHLTLSQQSIQRMFAVLRSVLREGCGVCGAIGRHPYAAYCELVNADDNQLIKDEAVSRRLVALTTS